MATQITHINSSPLNGERHGEQLHIGQELERARMAAGLSLNDVSQQLHIGTDYLAAIERLDKDELPSLGYVLGFVRSYTKFLGLNTHDAIERYKVESEIPRDLGVRNAPHFVEQREIRLPKGSVAAALILGCFCTMAFWYAGSSEAGQVQALALTPVAEQGPLIAAAENDPNLIKLRAIGPSWVEVKDQSGQIMVSRIFVSGEVYEAPKNSGLTISARDGGALELYRGGELLGYIGQKGQVVRNLALE